MQGPQGLPRQCAQKPLHDRCVPTPQRSRGSLPSRAGALLVLEVPIRAARGGYAMSSHTGAPVRIDVISTGGPVCDVQVDLFYGNRMGTSSTSRPPSSPGRK